MTQSLIGPIDKVSPWLSVEIYDIRRQQIECQCQQSINKRSNWFGLAWRKATGKSPVALAWKVERGTLFTKVASTHFWNVSKLLGISQSSPVALLHYAWDNVDDNDNDDVWAARNASVNFINISFFLDILIAHRARRAHCKRISPAKQNTLTLIRLFIGLPLLLTVPPLLDKYFRFSVCAVSFRNFHSKNFSIATHLCKSCKCWFCRTLQGKEKRAKAMSINIIDWSNTLCYVEVDSPDDS